MSGKKKKTKQAAGGTIVLVIALLVMGAHFFLAPSYSALDRLPERVEFGVEPSWVGVAMGFPFVLFAVLAFLVAAFLLLQGVRELVTLPFKKPEPESEPVPERLRTFSDEHPILTKLAFWPLVAGLFAYMGSHSLDYGLDYGARHGFVVEVPSDRLVYRCTYLGIPFRSSSGVASRSRWQLTRDDSSDRFSDYTLRVVPGNPELTATSTKLKAWWVGSLPVEITIPHGTSEEAYEALGILTVGRKAVGAAKKGDASPIDSSVLEKE